MICCDVSPSNPNSLNTRFLDQTSFVESFAAGSAGSAEAGLGIAAVNLARTVAVSVLRVADFAAISVSAAAVRAGISPVRAPRFVFLRRAAARTAATRVTSLNRTVRTAIAVASTMDTAPSRIAGVATIFTA